MATGHSRGAENWLESVNSQLECRDAGKCFDGSDLSAVHARIGDALRQLDMARKSIGEAEVELYKLRDHLTYEIAKSTRC